MNFVAIAIDSKNLPSSETYVTVNKAFFSVSSSNVLYIVLTRVKMDKIRIFKMSPCDRNLYSLANQTCTQSSHLAT